MTSVLPQTVVIDPAATVITAIDATCAVVAPAITTTTYTMDALHCMHTCMLQATIATVAWHLLPTWLSSSSSHVISAATAAAAAAAAAAATLLADA